MALNDEVEAIRQRADESEVKSKDLEEELGKVSNDVTDMEWTLNEQTILAEQTAKEVEMMRDQGHNIYAHIEEFGEEEEARVMVTERKIHTKMHEVTALKSRMSDITDVVVAANEKQRF